MNQSVLTHLRSQRVRDIFDRNHIERVYLVGSFARGEERDTSDIDLIFEKKIDARVTLLNIGNMKSSLEEEFGRNVDLVSSISIHPKLKSYLEQDKILLL